MHVQAFRDKAEELSYRYTLSSQDIDIYATHGLAIVATPQSPLTFNSNATGPQIDQWITGQLPEPLTWIENWLNKRNKGKDTAEQPW